MTDERPTERGRVGARLSALSPLALGVVGVIVFLGVAAGGYFAYRTYDYVQHDNDFCMSCHLMAEPFERFARSAHQELGCKACHRPNLIQRSQMGLTAVVDDPAEVSAHAPVPNQICAECHIEGDPEQWRSIANSVGHRVHLESEDSTLQGLQCVECHATSIHEFAPIDRTCAQSGCHEDNTIKLGSMGDYMIHCAACHTFVAPVGEASLLGTPEDAAILPDFEECLSCHVMRTLVSLPDPDPHEGGCAACHDPHRQTEPSEAAGSCASVGCHDDNRASTPFHRGIELETLTACLECHQAHDFSLDGSDCAACHAGAEAPTDVLLGTLEFDHTQHTTVDCGSCHSSGEEHGASPLTEVADCRSCHHEPVASADCAQCHGPEDAPDTIHRWTQSMVLDVGVNDPDRVMIFPHLDHADLDCASCHSEGLAMAPPADLDCASCHQDHHTPVSDCAACHAVAPVSAHPPTEAHVTCSGAGCHTDVPFENVPRTRSFCLGCHQDLRDHEPQETCSECHQLPAPRRQTGGLP
ncbi:MAG: hypothetical protein OEN56_04705 [Gemmatimonadota bacterium]|nr:hypothetical protein [Gemmatimonadota bacterium]